MARPRGFDEERAVEAAMYAFWSTGYEGTSTQDLCAATGLGRSSIYNAFSGKHDLFDQALRMYLERKTALALEVIESDLPMRERVRRLLWEAVEPTPDDPLGCLAVNTAIELGPHDPEVAKQLDRDQQRRISALQAAFVAARKAGELETDRSPRALADYVYAVLAGLRVAARGGASRATLEGIARTALTAF
jgi:TetR/AcrR family transcriptional repressor of nem operon